VIYCIDTSAIIDAMRRYYPPDAFPGLWEKLELMIESEELIAPKEVLHELSKKDDDTYEWAKNNSKIFIELDEEVQWATSEILNEFPRLVADMSGRNHADSFVIALARVKGAVVVTNEKRARNPKTPKIPDVCEHLDIRCIDLLNLILEKGWRF